MAICDLTGNVPLYGQKEAAYCGPACIEMCRNGYPNPADCLPCDQDDLKQIIDLNKSPIQQDRDQNWEADPQSVELCLQGLSNPASVNWAKVADPDGDRALFTILQRMYITQVPSPVMVDGGSHWVVIVGWRTDIDPIIGSTPIVEYIDIYDPKPLSKGSYLRRYKAQWDAKEWLSPVVPLGSWNGNYVAIVA